MLAATCSCCSISHFLLDDLLDGEDMVAICEDDKECRFYFPGFKERSKFKRLLKAETEGNQVRIITL